MFVFTKILLYRSNLKRKLGMYAGRENTCVETKKRNQVCKEQK